MIVSVGASVRSVHKAGGKLIGYKAYATVSKGVEAVEEREGTHVWPSIVLAWCEANDMRDTLRLTYA